MGAKNGKPAANKPGGSGAASKQKEPAGQKQLGDQEQAGGQTAPGASNTVQDSQGQTGSQAQPGTPAVASGADKASDQPGAEQSSSASSSSTNIPGLAVTSSRDGFWRAGRQWTKDKLIVRLSDLTDEQYDQIINEPMLKVVYVDDVRQDDEGA